VSDHLLEHFKGGDYRAPRGGLRVVEAGEE
jgi:hypothetical protein